jgi:hypothetical protein
MTHARQPKRLRGYRIHVWRGADHQPPSYTTPTLWRESPPAREWQQVIADPATQHAWMLQSGRKLKPFQFHRPQ